MIAVDTNILVYSHRADTEWHELADGCLARLAEGGHLWGIPWPCVHEFVSVVTHPWIFEPPTPLPQALGEVENWLACPSLVTLSEEAGYRECFAEVVRAGRILGPKVHDARIAALCLHHGVSELRRADRDFSRFPALPVRNPLTTP